MPGILGMIAGGAATGLMNRLFSNWSQSQQIAQQGKLMGMQIKGAKELADYNRDLQMQSWRETNIPAQVEMYKQAGMNPALMYGMGGGGGTTTGSGGGGMPSVATAEQPSNSIKSGMDMAMMMSQLKLINAQAKNAEADANLKNVDANKKGGVDTANVEAQTQNLLQGYDNLRQQHEINKLKITYDNLINYETQASQPDRLKFIETQTQNALQTLRQLQTQANLSETTYQDKVKQIKAEAIGATIHNELMKAGINKTQSDIQVNRQQIQNWYEQNMRDWDNMNLEQRKTRVQELLKDWHTDPNIKAIDQIVDMFNNFIFVKPAAEPRTVIEGFRKNY